MTFVISFSHWSELNRGPVPRCGRALRSGWKTDSLCPKEQLISWILLESGIGKHWEHTQAAPALNGFHWKTGGLGPSGSCCTIFAVAVVSLLWAEEPLGSQTMVGAVQRGGRAAVPGDGCGPQGHHSATGSKGWWKQGPVGFSPQRNARGGSWTPQTPFLSSRQLCFCVPPCAPAAWSDKAKAQVAVAAPYPNTV